MLLAILGGSVLSVQWLLRHGHPLRYDAVHMAGRYGHLTLLQYFAAQPSIHTPRLASEALVAGARRGSLKVVQWALPLTTSEVSIRQAITCANRRGHLAVLEFFTSAIDFSFADIPSLVTAATRRGHLNFVQHWFNNVPTAITQDLHGQCLRFAIKFGHADIASHFLLHRHPEKSVLRVHDILQAAKFGHTSLFGLLIHCRRWLRVASHDEQDMTWHDVVESAFFVAAKWGQLNLVQFFVEHSELDVSLTCLMTARLHVQHKKATMEAYFVSLLCSNS
ncbi:hypothetical protein DYB26_003603 [Aphanomyces astaci]|uniref:Uncharacterized protein n=1 Tax=Aphanomyces astaci TaxID=112090 RepID=A0A3R7B4I4_APHAT|nr:hypothetical protein DYB26_003603 [Aphanomyces astaci]